MAQFQKLRAVVFCFALMRIDLVFAYWRLACSVSQESRIDPIISPGGTSSHVHKFAGGINVGASSTGDSLRTSTCSTCEVQEDKSAYWTPSLYYQHPDGTFESVPNDGMTVYYVGWWLPILKSTVQELTAEGRGGNTSNTKPFPPGFRMISGDPKLRHYNTSALTFNNVRPIADRVSFRCINEADNGPDPHYIDQTNCVNGLRAQINFQSCWDGQTLYSADNSHVAYTSGIDYGDCPPTHPVPIPGLFYEVLYWVNDINQQPGGRFVLSNGDPTGYSFHADFINGWNQGILEDAVENCLYTDDGGVVQACAALAPSDDVNFSRTCLQAPDAVNESIRGTLAALPGCNPVTTDEVIAAHPSCSSSNTSTSTTSASSTTTVGSTTFVFTNSPTSAFPTTIQSLPLTLSMTNSQISGTNTLPFTSLASSRSSSMSLTPSPKSSNLLDLAASTPVLSILVPTTLITSSTSTYATTLPISTADDIPSSTAIFSESSAPFASSQAVNAWRNPGEYRPRYSATPPRRLRARAARNIRLQG